MSIEQMRVAVAKAYPGVGWANKVRKMPDAQVYTVYSRLKNSDKL